MHCILPIIILGLMAAFIVWGGFQTHQSNKVYCDDNCHKIKKENPSKDFDSEKP